MAEDSPSTQRTPGDQAGEIDVNPAAAVEKLDSWVDGAVALLPNILTALVVAALFYGLARLADRMVSRHFEARDRSNLGSVLGGFIRLALIITGFLLAATVVFPSLKPGDLIAGLGVSSVAIGFAFKDILQNWLAGLLILIRQPFEVGDQIEVTGFEGTVERIETRATIINTYDGQHVVIPNSDIYTNAVLVKTAEPQRRSQYDVGIGYADDIETACQTLREAVQGVSGVAAEPAVEALPWDLAASWVSIRVRWWTASPRKEVVSVHSQVILAIKRALDEAAIDMPYETRVQLFHDQTESTDGDRSAQREGWPDEGGGTVPRSKAEDRSIRPGSAQKGHRES